MDNFTQFFDNGTYLLDKVEVAYYVVSDWRNIIWSALYAIIIVVGAVGNFTIIWIVIADQKMRSVMNLFRVNLAFADGFIALFNVPFFWSQWIFGYWPCNNVICQLMNLFVTTNVGVSILTLSILSIIRFNAIMYPLKQKMGWKKAVMILIGIWLVSIVFLSPNWVYVTITYPTSDYGVIELYPQIWPDHNIKIIYRICIMIVLFFLPLVCIGFSYGRMAVKLWGIKPIGEVSQCQLKKKRAEMKYVKLLITIISAFVVCTLPFQLLFIGAVAELLVTVPLYFKDVFLAVYWMAFSNSMCNPIIYCVMNAKFRGGFKKAYKWVPYISSSTQSSMK